MKESSLRIDCPSHIGNEDMVRRLRIATMALSITILLLATLSPAQYAEAQQAASVTAEPSFINLGLPASIVVKAPAAGTYTVTITKPDGKTQAQLDYSFSQVGESKQIYGNASIGFKSVIDLVGTYKVSLQTGGKQIAEATFFATDKLVLDLSVANAGTSDNVCFTSNQFTRGTSIIPRVWVKYASTGEYVIPENSPKAVVTFTLPNGTKMDTRFAPYLPPKGAWRNCFRPNWNDYAGIWNIVAEASDGKGNFGKIESYPQVALRGMPLRLAYEIMPAPLTITTRVLDASTGKSATTDLARGQNLRIEAKAEYQHPLGPLGREWATGYLGLLNTTRGGQATAKIGWGFYNETSKIFGGTDTRRNPGGLVATIPLSYDRVSGLWVGTYAVTGSEPKGEYMVIIDGKDSANPPNTGTVKLKLASPSEVVEKTVERVVTTTVDKIVEKERTVEKPVEKIVERPIEKIVEVIPAWSYGVMGGLLVVGVVIGMISRRRK